MHRLFNPGVSELLLEQIERHPAPGEVHSGRVAVVMDSVSLDTGQTTGSLVLALDRPSAEREQLVIVPDHAFVDMPQERVSDPFRHEYGTHTVGCLAVQDPRPSDHPIAIYTITMPECPYQEVGLVSSRKRNDLYVSMEETMEGLKKRTREMGGDAVVSVTEVNEDQRYAGNTATKDLDPVLSGTVIRFSDPSCTN